MNSPIFDHDHGDCDPRGLPPPLARCACGALPHRVTRLVVECSECSAFIEKSETDPRDVDRLWNDARRHAELRDTAERLHELEAAAARVVDVWDAPHVTDAPYYKRMLPAVATLRELLRGTRGRAPA